jgi:hypothetical protein
LTIKDMIPPIQNSFVCMLWRRVNENLVAHAALNYADDQIPGKFYLPSDIFLLASHFPGEADSLGGKDHGQTATDALALTDMVIGAANAGSMP